MLDPPFSTSSVTSNATDNPSGNPIKSHSSGLTSGVKRKLRSPTTLTAVYLPEVAPEQGWTKKQTLDSAMRKAGYE